MDECQNLQALHRFLTQIVFDYEGDYQYQLSPLLPADSTCLLFYLNFVASQLNTTAYFQLHSIVNPSINSERLFLMTLLAGHVSCPFKPCVSRQSSLILLHLRLNCYFFLRCCNYFCKLFLSQLRSRAAVGTAMVLLDSGGLHQDSLKKLDATHCCCLLTKAVLQPSCCCLCYCVCLF